MAKDQAFKEEASSQTASQAEEETSVETPPHSTGCHHALRLLHHLRILYHLAYLLHCGGVVGKLLHLLLQHWVIGKSGIVAHHILYHGIL